MKGQFKRQPPCLYIHSASGVGEQDEDVQLQRDPHRARGRDRLPRESVREPQGAPRGRVQRVQRHQAHRLCRQDAGPRGARNRG